MSDMSTDVSSSRRGSWLIDAAPPPMIVISSKSPPSPPPVLSLSLTSGQYIMGGVVFLPPLLLLLGLVVWLAGVGFVVVFITVGTGVSIVVFFSPGVTLLPPWCPPCCPCCATPPNDPGALSCESTTVKVGTKMATSSQTTWDMSMLASHCVAC